MHNAKKLERISRDMEMIYQAKVMEKHEKLQENKENVSADQ